MSMEASMNSSSAQNESVKTESSQMDMVVIAKRQRFQDIVFHRLTQTFSLLVLLALTGIIASLFINAWPAFQKFGINFIWRVEWDIVNEEFGAAISIVGTLASAGIAMLIAVPLAFGIAVFLTETCPTWLRRPLGTAIELLAAVPSIIYGMFGLFVFAPLFADYMQVPLQKILGGMPLVGFLFGGSTNGMGILAYTQTGVIGGIMLGLGRALGETMAVTFVIGNANRMPTSLFSPGTSIASTLANEFGEAAEFHIATLFALAFLLFAITFVVLAMAKVLINRTEKAKGV